MFNRIYDVFTCFCEKKGAQAHKMRFFITFLYNPYYLDKKRQENLLKFSALLNLMGFKQKQEMQ